MHGNNEAMSEQHTVNRTFLLSLSLSRSLSLSLSTIDVLLLHGHFVHIIPGRSNTQRIQRDGRPYVKNPNAASEQQI